MINFIIFFFFILYQEGFLSLERIFITNLLLLIICRGIYIIAYYFRYYKDYDKELEKGVKLFSKNEKIYFSIKQISIILFGIIYYPIAVFISFYSLMVSTSYLTHISKNIRFKYIDLIAKLFNILIPLMGIIWFLFIDLDYYWISRYWYKSYSLSSLWIKNR